MNQKIVLGLINLIFGSMVLLSYYYGVGKLKSAGKDPALLWGGVPEIIQPAIVVFMFLGAIGYFFFTYNFLFNINTDQVFLKRFNYSSLHMLYLLIFIPSMVWIGLTIDYIDSSRSLFDWAVIAIVLLTVAAASVFLLLFSIDLKSDNNTFMYYASVIGAAIFTFHTLFLDGLVWLSLFHRNS